MIYCVIPREWVDDLYDKMVAYYADNREVEVIVDRREGDRRARHGGGSSDGSHERELRDRRRGRFVGTFPAIDVADA